jgi:hypothetical protein
VCSRPHWLASRETFEKSLENQLNSAFVFARLAADGACAAHSAAKRNTPAETATRSRRKLARQKNLSQTAGKDRKEECFFTRTPKSCPMSQGDVCSETPAD